MEVATRRRTHTHNNKQAPSVDKPELDERTSAVSNKQERYEDRHTRRSYGATTYGRPREEKHSVGKNSTCNACVSLSLPSSIPLSVSSLLILDSPIPPRVAAPHSVRHRRALDSDNGNHSTTRLRTVQGERKRNRAVSV